MNSMSFGSGGMNIERLREDNYHVWKHRVELALGLKDLDDYIEGEPPLDFDEYKTWQKGDKKARGVIAMAIQDEHLEQVQHALTAKEMWNMIKDLFEKQTLLNKISARRSFYTAKLEDGEKMLKFAARIRQLAATLKSMGGQVDDREMAMALLCGLPDRFDSLVSALDTHVDNESTFTFQFVLSRCVQEEQRQSERDRTTLAKSETAALLASQKKKPMCEHCGKHPDSAKCFWKYPHLAPKKSSRSETESSSGNEAARFELSVGTRFTV